MNNEENRWALIWWRKLSKKEQFAIWKESKFSHWSFDMFKTSTFAIRNTWIKEAAKEDKK